tara:strand:+ start:107 stop:559 length:453 start_codon:yes stop_codon:yes gene_type:complete
MGSVGDAVVDFVTEDVLGMPSEEDIRNRQLAEQRKMEQRMREQAAANLALTQQRNREAEARAIQSQRQARAKTLRKTKQRDIMARRAEMQGSVGARIAGVAGQRLGTGKLKKGSAERMKKTKQGYGKWGAQSRGLHIGLRGSPTAGRRPK